ncbi:MAG: PepSY domain-containing protein [Lautropia sp.]|nr:PepSY domain-containing protein [Lautropia sp.]
MFRKALVTLAAISALGASASAIAATECKLYPENERIPAEKFQQQLQEQGYKIRKFKETRGNCYEIYGFDKAGKKVEIYFDMKTGEIVKRNEQVHDTL